MRRIESLIDTNAADYKANYAAMSERLKEFHARQHAARFDARNAISTALPARTNWACASG